MDSQSTSKFVLALLVPSFHFQLRWRQANWNNPNTKFDLEKLEQIPVPKGFPENTPLEHMKNVKVAKDQNGLMILIFS